MKNKRTIFFAALMLILLPFSCNMDETGTVSNKEPDSKSYFPNHGALISTDFDESIVAFLGEISDTTILGRIPAHAREHGISKELFQTTGAYRLLFMRYSDFQANRKNLNASTVRNAFFTSLFVFYNNNGDNDLVYHLAKEVGGPNRLRMINTSTSLNIELRIGGIAGRTLGYAQAKYLETTIRVDDGNFNLFPVFVRYNSTRDMLERIYPTASDGSPWFTSISFGDFSNGQSLRDYTINFRDVLMGLNMSSGTAWIIVDNQTVSGGVRFMESGVVHYTLTGLENAMPSIPLTHQIRMPTVINGNINSYADSRIIYNLRFGPTGHEVMLQQSEFDFTPLQSLNVERDKVYTIVVAGDHNQGTLKAWVSNVTDMNLNEFYMD